MIPASTSEARTAVFTTNMDVRFVEFLQGIVVATCVFYTTGPDLLMELVLYALETSTERSGGNSSGKINYGTPRYRQ